MEFSRRDIIQALCNEYNHLFKDAYDPGIDLSFEEYQSAMEAKTLEELIKETSTDSEFYTLDNFMKRYGWSRYLIGLACIRELSFLCSFKRSISPKSFSVGGWDGCPSVDDFSSAVAVFCTMSSSAFDPEGSTDAGTMLESR